MTLRPFSVNFLRGRPRGRRWDGDGKEDEITQDGTVDVHGRPASKRTTGAWKGAAFVLGLQVMANIAFYGISSNLIIYITGTMHETNSAGASNVNNWWGSGYVFPLLGGFIADSYCGRFWTSVIFSGVSVVGSTLMAVIGTVRSLRPAQCPNEDSTCPKPTRGQAVFFYAALYVIDIGAGGLQGAVVPFGADQFDEEDEKEMKQNSSYFNQLYNCYLIGSFVGSTLFVYLQEDVSLALAWGICAGLMLVGFVILVSGARVYRYHKPGGNPLTRMAQVIVAYARKSRHKVASVDDLYDVHDAQPGFRNIRKVQHTNKFRFLDKAALITNEDHERGQLQNPWRLCSVTQVEELKFLLRIVPIFFFNIMYTICYSQLTTLFIEQGYTMDRNLGSFPIPASSFPVFECLSVFFWVTVYDRLLVPFLRRLTGNPRGISELKRMGIGLAVSILAMAVAALVEIRRLHVVREHGLEDDDSSTVPMSCFWEVPQYFLIGLSETFFYIGQMEFFYDQAPDGIRGLGSSIVFLNWALGYFLATALLKIVGRITTKGGNPGWVADNLNQGRIDLFYWLLAVMSFVNLVGFVICAMRFEYTVTQGPVSRMPPALQLEPKGSNPSKSPEQCLVKDNDHKDNSAQNQ